MIREIIKRILNTWDNSLEGNKLCIEYNEAFIELTDNELEIFVRGQSDTTVDEELRPILKKLLSLMYISRGSYCTMFVLTPELRKGGSAMRAFMGMAGKDTMRLTKAECKFLVELMRTK